VRLRVLNVGCFGGGTGLPSLLGGLKANPWVSLHAVVTMFDSGGSSGQLRDELGVLPPGDVLRCALALPDAAAQVQPRLRIELRDDERRAGVATLSDLLGMPVRITVSPRSIENGGAEVKLRTEKDGKVVLLADAATTVGELLPKTP